MKVVRFVVFTFCLLFSYSLSAMGDGFMLGSDDLAVRLSSSMSSVLKMGVSEEFVKILAKMVVDYEVDSIRLRFDRVVKMNPYVNYIAYAYGVRHRLLNDLYDRLMDDVNNEKDAYKRAVAVCTSDASLKVALYKVDIVKRFIGEEKAIILDFFRNNNLLDSVDAINYFEGGFRSGVYNEMARVFVPA